ncbi:MAG: HAD-IIA family hydrolase [Candidatus Hodarchaeales archaeon]
MFKNLYYYQIHMKKIKAFLIDIEGTIVFKNNPVQGAQGIIDLLREKNYGLRFITNIDSKTRTTIAGRMKSLGFEIKETEIINPPLILKSIFQYPGFSAQIISSREIRDLFSPIFKSNHPDYVVVGDVEEYSDLYAELNTAFRNLLDGSDFLAFKPSLYYISSGGYKLDTGAFVRLLEEASGQKATILGKPARKFFEYALDDLGVAAQETVVIGDSIETDIRGGVNIGATTILVKTGIQNVNDLEKYKIQPDLIIPSIADLIEWL